MKVPDKIYLTPVNTITADGTRLEGLSCVYSIGDRKYENEIEYIRKDALLDYFHQRVEEFSSPLNGVFGSTEMENCNERISELLLLIDKLSEM